MRLETITALFDGDGPFVSVYLDVGMAVEDALQQIDLRWKNARRGLAEQGVDDAMLEQLDQHVARDHGRGAILRYTL